MTTTIHYNSLKDFRANDIIASLFSLGGLEEIEKDITYETGDGQVVLELCYVTMFTCGERIAVVHQCFNSIDEFKATYKAAKD